MNKILHSFFTLICLITFTNTFAQYNFIVEVSELEKNTGICNADATILTDPDDPIFEFDCYEYNGGTSVRNYDPNIWIGRSFEGIWNPRTNDMNCNGYVLASGHNRPASSNILKLWLKGSDEDGGWNCNHNSNSCVSGWNSTDYTYRNDPINQWNQVQLNWSDSYRAKVKVRWGNYYANPQSDYGNEEWLGAFYDNTDFTTYKGYMTENETFDVDFANINENDGTQDYRLFGNDNTTSSTNTLYTEYSIANINNQYKTYYGNIDKGIKVSLNKKIDLIKSYRTTEINIYDNAQQLKSNLIKYNNSNPKKVNTNEVEYNLANDITYNIKQLSDKIKSSIIINTNLFSNYNLYDYVGFEEEIELKANK